MEKFLITAAPRCGSGWDLSLNTRSLMNAPLSFSEEVSGSADMHDSPYIGEEVLKRRARRRFLERFEQAFFVGLLLTLIVFTVFVVLSEYTTPSALASSGPLKVDEKESPAAVPVRVSWESEPTFETEIPEPLADAEMYPVVGESIDTTWIDEDGGMFSLEANPYVAEEAEASPEAVEAPEPVPGAKEGMVSLPETVPVRAYLGETSMVESNSSTTRRVEESAASPLELDPSGRVGVLRVGGGHARDLIRLYTAPAVVYGLE